MRATALLLVACAMLTGCASTRRLLVRATPTTTATATAPAPVQTHPREPSADAYLAQLRAKEQTLAAAERRLPGSAPTPQALSHSASLLAGAVSQLGRGLAAIKPPPAVAHEHAQLVAVVRTYAGQLRNAAALAGRPGGQVAAGSLLVTATGSATSAFNTTLSKIYSTLGVRQP